MKRLIPMLMVLFMVLSGWETGYAQTTLREIYRQWTYETVLNDFNTLQCNIRCTFLSPQLLQAWQQSETDATVANRVTALINAMQQQNVLIYILTVDPGESDLYLVDFRKIQKKSRLFITDKKSKGYKPKRVTNNLKRKLTARQPYYGAMAFVAESSSAMFQTLRIETKFEYFEKFNIPDEEENKEFELQFNFHAAGAPREQVPATVPGTQEILGQLKVAFSLVNLVTKQNI